MRRWWMPLLMIAPLACAEQLVATNQGQLESSDAQGFRWDRNAQTGAIGDGTNDCFDTGLWLTVNGQQRQKGTTKTMIFNAEFIVHYLSQFMTLEAGDVITTGTPPGVGMGMKPTPVFLKAGDEMRLGIAGLGEQRQKVHAWNAALIDE